MPVILVVGDNGVGKSNLLGAIAAVGESPGRHVPRIPGSRATVHVGEIIELMDPCVSDRVHPRRLPDVMGRLGERRVVAVTYSPYVVSQVPYEQVWALAKPVGAAGPYGVRLSDHPDAERRRVEMDAGEFWSNYSDDWVLNAPRGRLSGVPLRNALIEAALR